MVDLAFVLFSIGPTVFVFVNCVEQFICAFNIPAVSDTGKTAKEELAN